jgi:type VI secretion system secreted protein VgrG
MAALTANASRFAFKADGVEFLVVQFKAVEELSKPFSVQLSLATEKDIQLDAMIGKEGVLQVDDGDGRCFHGIINEFRQAERKGRFYLYRVRLVPSLWLLSLRRDCRIFQNLSTPDIIKRVLTSANIFLDRVIFRLRGSYAPREYCVQYRETDFHFISRLLEEEGIFYFFGHDPEKHLLIFGDDNEVCRPILGESTVPYHPSDGLVADEGFVNRFEPVRRLHTDKVTLTDYNYLKPSVDLTCNQTAKDGLALGNFDCPGGFLNTDLGNRRARIRLEEAAMLRHHAKGHGSCPRLTAGHFFTLTEHDRPELDGKYLLVQVRHRGQQPQVLGEHSADGHGSVYGNDLVAVPAGIAFRPPRKCSKVRMTGIQSAIVMGPKSEEIYTDKYGRVKVKFYWDHASEDNGAKIADEQRTCWIRVVQSAAGPGWGTLFLPRVGHEVIVDFLEGDPDRPIITGQVYHGDHRPPYDLPGEKTKSAIKTNSTPHGGGFNEIRFEDKKDNEQLFMHAQKNFDLRVLNDRAGWIGHENHLMIIKDHLEQIGGDQHLTVSGDRNVKVGGTVCLESGSDLQTKVGGKHGVDAGMEVYLKAGMKIIIEAGTQVSLKAGGSFVDIGPAGVTLQGAMVNINSGGSAGSGSGVSVETPKAPREADTAKAGETAQPYAPQPPLSPQAAAFKEAAKSGTPFCDT